MTPSGVKFTRQASSYLRLLVFVRVYLRQKVCLCQQESRWMCGCVHRSVKFLYMLYVCGKVHTVYQTPCPSVASVWEHKYLHKLCVFLYAVLSPCYFLTVSLIKSVHVTESF